MRVGGDDIRGPRGERPWGAILAALLLGALLAGLSLPRIGAHASLVPAAAAVAALDSGAAIEPAALQAAYAAHDRALAWQADDPQLRRDRARIARRLSALADANENTDPADDGRVDVLSDATALREAALADLRLAAAAAPGDGLTWALLADAGLDAGASLEAVLPALRLARLTAPRRASALLLQHRIVMRHWTAMPDEMRAHALADLPALWRRGQLRGFLVASYLDAGFAARAAFRERLSEDPRALPQFDRLLSAALGT